MSAEIFDMPLTPNAKLVGIALRLGVSRSNTVDDLARITGLDKHATERAFREYSVLNDRLLSSPSEAIKTPYRPVYARKKLGLNDVMKSFQSQVNAHSVKRSKSSQDYMHLRQYCRIYGLSEVLDGIARYFSTGYFKSEAHIGIRSLGFFLSRTTTPKIGKYKRTATYARPRITPLV